MRLRDGIMRLRERIAQIVYLFGTLLGLLLVACGCILIKIFSTNEIDKRKSSDVLSGPRDPIQEWTLIKKMGSGSSATVHSTIDSDGFILGVKISEKTRNQNYNMEAEFLREYGHENIVKFYATVEDDENHFMFTELMPLKSLSSLILKMKQGLTERQASRYIRQLLLALSHLHDDHIIHRDIKGANILVGPGGIVKLADFGSAIKINDLGHVTGCVGTYHWMAPEVRTLQCYGVAADIWSLGCTTIELLSGKPPYSNMSQAAAVARIQSGGKPDIPTNLSSDSKQFILGCLEVRATDRPTVSELLRHPFITKFVTVS